MIIIKNLSGADFKILQKYLVEKTINKNDILYDSGFKGTSMFFVETGNLKIVNRKSSAGLEDQVIGLVKPGGFCGEEVILNDGGIYSQTVIAIEKTVLQVLDIADLQKIMAESTVAGSKLILAVSKNYRDAINLTEKLGKMIAFVSAKDGTGRTTVCMNLAKAIARRNKKVIVIDCDFQLGNAHMHIGKSANPNISRLIQMEDHLTYDRIANFITHADGYHLLASPELPQDSELITRSQVNQIVHECSKNYDYVLLDVSSHINEFSLLLWDLADILVLVQRACLSDLIRFRRLMSAMKRLNYPIEKYLGIITCFEEGQEEYIEQFKSALSTDWLTVSNDPEIVAKALFNGVNIAEQSSSSKIVFDIDNICIRLLTGKIVDSKEKAGIFSWLKNFYAGKK